MAVTDLTNTKWKINSTTCTAGYGQFSVNHTCTPDYQGGTIYIGYTYDIRTGASPTANVVTLMGSLHELEANDVLEITGGTDVTNANLISWLTANATQITSGGSMYLGTSTISKMYLGQAEVSKVYLGQDLVYEKQASTTMSFTIGSTTYQADDGMTWTQWVNSSYNTEGLRIVTGGYVYWAGLGNVLSGFEQVRYDELIIANEEYRTSGEN